MAKNVFEQIGVTPVQAGAAGAIIFLGYTIAKKFGLVQSEEGKKEAQLLAAPFLSSTYTDSLTREKKKFMSWTNVQTPKDIAKQIKESKGLFNDNEAKLWSALKRIQFKTQAGVVAYWFSRIYGEDLTQYLNGFNTKSEMAKIYDYLNGLKDGIVA